MKVLPILSQRMVTASKPSILSIKKPVATTLKETQKPIIANIKSYYSSPEEKLNDILLDKIERKKNITPVEHNIKEYEELPESIKKCIKPSDITRDGHIDQDKINQIWDAAQKAKKPGVYGRAPIFKGEEIPETTGLVGTTELAPIPEFDIDNIGSEADILADSVFETNLDIGDSEFMEVAEKIIEIDDDKANLLSDIIDILS